MTRRALIVAGLIVGVGFTAAAVAVAASRLGLGDDAQSSATVCDRPAADAASLARELDAASAGQAICLAAGEYGTFRGARMPGPVRILPQPGAKVSMTIEFDGVTNLRLDGVTIKSAVIGGDSRNLTIANSDFTGLAVVHADRMAGAGIRFDGNRHVDIDTCVTCFQGRLHVDGDSGRPAGVTIANSLFGGGNADGIRADANGIQIVNNEFTRLRDEDPFHTDPIQINGGKRILIRSNYIHDNAVSAGITMADGGVGNVVEDNVIEGSDSTWALTWMSDDGSVIRHNTFVGGACQFKQPCGAINLGAKAGDRPGRGTVISDNVMTGVSNEAGGTTSRFSADHNLTPTEMPGAGNVVGTPRYADRGSGRTGYRLAAGSPGRGIGSDGRDAGIR